MSTLRPRPLIHLFASQPHYVRHIKAVWKHLPLEMRGEERVGRAASPRGLPADDFVMIGGFIDVDRVPNNRLVYVEHGAGQTYLDNKRPEWYPGGDHPERVVGYICPRKQVAEMWKRPAIAVGCPALVDIHRERKYRPYRRTIAITFHWDARKVCPEARSARDHWIDSLHEIVAWARQWEYELVGHWHPRDRDAPEIWRNLNLRVMEDPDDVLREVWMLIADNTSLMYEAAALDIPVIALNAPWYRRDVHHGLRFWDAVPGYQFDNIDELIKLNLDHYFYSDVSKNMRQRAAIAAFGYPRADHAGIRAAQWVEELTMGLTAR